MKEVERTHWQKRQHRMEETEITSRMRKGNLRPAEDRQPGKEGGKITLRDTGGQTGRYTEVVYEGVGE